MIDNHYFFDIIIVLYRSLKCKKNDIINNC